MRTVYSSIHTAIGEKSMKTIQIGILGIGNVAKGTYQTLELNRKRIEASTGASLSIAKILNRSPEKDRGIDIPKEVYVTDPYAILHDPDIDIVVELIGGIEPATQYMAEALRSGKHVVTANKAALAANGRFLQSLAQENHVMLRFEASVGGGIPIINAITTSLLSNDFDEILGILNGTTNYILTQMTDNGLSYDAVLKDAQAKGLAETDPTADVEGIDVANKLAILLSLIFGVEIAPGDIPTHGITSVTTEDINYATEFGYKIKLIASARKHGEKFSCDVEPTLVPFAHPLAAVSNEFNAIYLTGNAVDDLMFYGKGAGPLPTGSAVMGDIISIARRIEKESAYDLLPLLRYDEELSCIGEGSNRYYIRLSAVDRPGVLGNISSTFGRYGIGIASMVQRAESSEDMNTVPLIFIVYQVERDVLNQALQELVDKEYVEEIGSVLKVHRPNHP